MLLAGGNDKVVGLFLLQDKPHAFHVVLGVAPVAQGVEVSKVELFLEALGDAACGQCDFAGDESLSAPLAFVVEQNSVGTEHAVRLAVVFHDPKAVKLGHGIRRARIKWRGLFLRNFLHKAKELRSGGLVNAASLVHSQKVDGFQNAQNAGRVRVGGVFGNVKADLYMALGAKVVDFGRLNFADKADQAFAVGKVSVVELYLFVLVHVLNKVVNI